MSRPPAVPNPHAQTQSHVRQWLPAADSHGNQWWISTHVEDVSPEEMQRRQAGETEAAEGR